MNYTPRPYQSKAVNAVWAALGKGFKSPLIVSPTGSGKTVIACILIEMAMAGARVLFLAHRSELISQCANKLREIGIWHGIIKAGMDAGSHHDRVQVASVQTFCSRLKHMRKDYCMIIVDEGHHSTASTYRQVIGHCNNPIVIGLTATPYRTDGAALGDMFDTLIPVTDTATLMREGHLVPARIFRGVGGPDLSQIRTLCGDYDADELGERMSKPKLTGHAVSEYIRLCLGRRAIAFCASVKHSQTVVEAFKHAGIAAEHLDGMTPAFERAMILERFGEGKTLVLANCGVLTEGYDEPRIEAILALRPTKSRCLWRQMSGRGLRLCPEIGKTHVAILDHAGWTKEHGYLTDPDVVDLKGGLKKERQKSMSKCQRCGAEFVRRPAICPECGCALPAGTGLDFGLGDENVTLAEDMGGYVAPAAKTFVFAPPPVAMLPAKIQIPSAPRLGRLRQRRK